MRLVHFILLLATVVRGASADYPPPNDLGPTNTYGYGIQRTMRALETSDPLKKSRIRVLCYGQSVTAQPWYWLFKTDLENRFPNAAFEIENRAVAFLSPALLRAAESDLYSFYPDLLVFQVYGPLEPYEQIIQRTRARTTAEILMHNEHVHLQEDMNEPVLLELIPPGFNNAYRNYVELPAIAEKYGAELVDIRTRWRKYLNDNGLAATNVLRDQIHFNDQGNYLFNQLLGAHLRVDHSLPPPATNAIVTLKVGSSIEWLEGEIVVDFVGNRVDLVYDHTPFRCPLQFYLDGKRPSEFPELYGVTRVSLHPDGPWPVVVEVGALVPRVVEDWTMEITDFNRDTFTARYKVTGSVTGYDGEGTNWEDFVSNSGRVVMTAADWGQSHYFWHSLGGNLPVGTIATWKVYPRFLDEFTPAFDPASTTENVQTIVSGLGNGSHTLRITGGACEGLAAVRIYNPLAMKHPERERVKLAARTEGRDGIVLNFEGSNRCVVEGRDSLTNGTWVTLTAPVSDPVIKLKKSEDRQFLRARVLD